MNNREKLRRESIKEHNIMCAEQQAKQDRANARKRKGAPVTLERLADIYAKRLRKKGAPPNGHAT